jgi:hypothetical protein
MERKFYSAFPDHLDVQPIPSTLSSLEFDSPLEECFAISPSQVVYLLASKDFLRKMVPRFVTLCAEILENFGIRWLFETLKNQNLRLMKCLKRDCDE